MTVLTEPVLQADGVSVAFATRGGTVQAVDGASLKLFRGETVALVGESGSGKSTLARALSRSCSPSGGSVEFRGQDIWSLRGRDLRDYRKNVQLMFQDPYSSLDPRMTVREIIAEPLRAHGSRKGPALDGRVDELLRMVSLDPDDARFRVDKFSGGQRQRIALARALALDPEVLVADEPVSALDVSVQAQVVELLQEIQARTNLSLFIVSHDLELMSVVADRILVMYLGQIVEQGPTEDVVRNPQHPYTAALLSAIPSISTRQDVESRFVLSGEIPSPMQRPDGCHFHPRCPIATQECQQSSPSLSGGDTVHDVSCFRPGEFGVESGEAAQSLGPV